MTSLRRELHSAPAFRLSLENSQDLTCGRPKKKEDMPSRAMMARLRSPSFVLWTTIVCSCTWLDRCMLGPRYQKTSDSRDNGAAHDAFVEYS